MKISTFLLSLTVSGTTLASDIAPFAADDRVCFVGDSLTAQGGYHGAIVLFYATRLPTRRLQAWNCGIAGDTARGSFLRYDWDIAPHRPSVITLMTGVNDVNRGLYTNAEPSATNLAQRQQAIDTNTRYLNELAAKARQEGVRVILITPAIYDQTAQFDPPAQMGINDALVKCSEGLVAAAATHGCDVVNFNAPMLAINQRWQSSDPAQTIVGKDRIHPGAAGHLLMAYLFLKAQGMTPTVANVAIDAKTRELRDIDNCQVSDLVIDDSGVSFRYLAGALPFPVNPAAKDALTMVPFIAELNQEVITVANLPAGSYELAIDGQPQVVTSAADLEAGVNLAVVESTPQYQQAVKIRDLVALRERISPIIRTYSLLKQQFFPDQDALSQDEILAILQQKYDELHPKPSIWNDYRCSVIKRYQQSAADRPDLIKQYNEAMAQIYQLNQPVTHTITLRRTAAGDAK